MTSMIHTDTINKKDSDNTMNKIYNTNTINPSICIPRVDIKYTKDYIYDIFYKLNIGKIERIDSVYNYKTNTQRIFIHFKYWNTDEKSERIKSIILKQEDNNYFKLVYNFPEYWKCYNNKATIYI